MTATLTALSPEAPRDPAPLHGVGLWMRVLPGEWERVEVYDDADTAWQDAENHPVILGREHCVLPLPEEPLPGRSRVA